MSFARNALYGVTWFSGCLYIKLKKKKNQIMDTYICPALLAITVINSTFLMLNLLQNRNLANHPVYNLFGFFCYCLFVIVGTVG